MTPGDVELLQRLEALRAEMGLSPGKMAAALGIERQTYAGWMQGRPGWKRGKFPPFKALSIKILLELRAIDPSNPELPEALRANPAA